MKSKNIRAHTLIRFKLGIEPKLIQFELKPAVSEHASSFKTIYREIVEFKKNSNRLQDKPRPGPSITVSTASNIKLVRELIDDDPNIGHVQNKAQTSINYGTILKIFHDNNFNMRKIASRWVPHTLSEKNRNKCNIVRTNLAMISDGKWRLYDLMKGDEP